MNNQNLLNIGNEIDYPNEIKSFDESRYMIALEQLGYIVFNYDIAAQRIFIPDATAKKLGLPVSIDCHVESLLKNGFIHPSSSKACSRMLGDIQNGKPFSRCTIQIRSPGGRFLWCDCALSTQFEGKEKKPLALALIKNINTQREKERKLFIDCRYQEAILSSVIHIYKINISSDTIIKGNEDWEQRFGIMSSNRYSEMLTTISEKFIHADEGKRFAEVFSVKNVLKVFEQKQTEIMMECRCAEPDNSFIWTKCTMSLLSDPDTEEVLAVVTIKNIDKRKKREAEMQYLAERDSLSKLYNHGATIQHIKKFLSSEEGNRNMHALIVLDIDNFKGINDTRGHLHGDNLLTLVAKSMQDIFRSTDILGRVGGDEFLLLLKNISNQDKAVRKAAEINQVINSLGLTNMGLSVSVSIGIAIYPSHGSTFEELFHKADTALYQAKDKGKNTYILYDKT